MSTYFLNEDNIYPILDIIIMDCYKMMPS